MEVFNNIQWPCRAEYEIEVMLHHYISNRLQCQGIGDRPVIIDILSNPEEECDNTQELPILTAQDIPIFPAEVFAHTERNLGHLVLANWKSINQLYFYICNFTPLGDTYACLLFIAVPTKSKYLPRNGDLSWTASLGHCNPYWSIKQVTDTDMYMTQTHKHIYTCVCLFKTPILNPFFFLCSTDVLSETPVSHQKHKSHICSAPRSDQQSPLLEMLSSCSHLFYHQSFRIFFPQIWHLDNIYTCSQLWQSLSNINWMTTHGNDVSAAT